MKGIILISAKAQNGKDATADILKRKLEQHGNKVCITHYADNLKWICQKYFNWDGKKDEKGREILQKVGTDYVRKELKMCDFHVNRVIEEILISRKEYDWYIIPDTRFGNEIENMKAMFSNVISLRVKRLNFISSLTKEQLQHESEVALDDYDFDYYIESESGINNLEKAIDNHLKGILY